MIGIENPAKEIREMNSVIEETTPSALDRICIPSKVVGAGVVLDKLSRHANGIYAGYKLSNCALLHNPERLPICRQESEHICHKYLHLLRTADNSSNLFDRAPHRLIEQHFLPPLP